MAVLLWMGGIGREEMEDAGVHADPTPSIRSTN